MNPDAVAVGRIPFGRHSDAPAGSPGRPVIAHFVFPYLFATGSWVYGQLVNMRTFQPIVLTSQTVNLDVFPFNPIYTYHDVSSLKKALLALRNRRWKGIRKAYFEWVLRQQHTRLLHAHFGTCGVEMLEVKRRCKLPMITTFYGADVSQVPREPKWHRQYAILFGEGELFLAEGNAMRRALVDLGCPEQKVVVQRLGVDLDALPFVSRRPDPSGVVRILIAATFREKKGIPDALRAVAMVRSRLPQLRVTLLGDSAGKAGDDEEKETILSLLKKLDGVVTWQGFQPYRTFQQALFTHHLFLSPSRTARDGDTEGGAPVGLIEAQATGMPILSTFHADIPEVVLDGKTGLLCPEGDVEALAANLARLAASPHLWEPMGRAGRAHVEANHDVKKQVKHLEAIYSTFVCPSNLSQG